MAPQGLILSGGPASVYDPGALRCDPAIFELGVPVLGICYGLQLACQILGGKVLPSSKREFGRAHCHIHSKDPLFTGVPEDMVVWMSHGDQVQSADGEFLALARTDTCPVAAVRHARLPLFGLQFHPEVSHTPYGNRILRNFLYEICGCQGLWRLPSFADQTVAELRQRIGCNRVICGLSGGVDSSVTAAMLLRAVGGQVACIFVDNGLLRKGENEAVRRTFRDHFHADLHVVDARERFLSRQPGSPTRRRNDSSSVTSSSMSSETRHGALKMFVFSLRERSIPMSSRAAPLTTGRRQRSRHTTMSADFPRNWASS